MLDAKRNSTERQSHRGNGLIFGNFMHFTKRMKPTQADIICTAISLLQGHRHVATITEKTLKTKVPTGLIPTNLARRRIPSKSPNWLSGGNEAKAAKTINVILYGNQDWIAISTTSTGQMPSPQKPGLTDDRPIIRWQPRAVVLGRDWFLREIEAIHRNMAKCAVGQDRGVVALATQLAASSETTLRAKSVLECPRQLFVLDSSLK